jgi:hypothetical protein
VAFYIHFDPLKTKKKTPFETLFNQLFTKGCPLIFTDLFFSVWDSLAAFLRKACHFCPCSKRYPERNHVSQKYSHFLHL